MLISDIQANCVHCVTAGSGQWERYICLFMNSAWFQR